MTQAQNFLSPQTISIAVGDKLNASILNGAPGGYVNVTNVSSAVNANGQITDYTITLTGGYVTPATSASKFTLSGNNANGSNNWVLSRT